MVTAKAPTRRRRKEARPAELVEAALIEFASKGFAAARLEDVAVRAGVSKATIYVYFADKQALFEACMKSRIGHHFDSAAAMADAFPGTMEDLLRLLVAAIHTQLRDPNTRALLRVIIAESGNFPFLAAFHYRQNVSKGKAIIGRIIERGIASGEFRQGDYAALPMMLLSPAIMATVWSLMFNALDPLDAENAIHAHLDLVLNGIKQQR